MDWFLSITWICVGIIGWFILHTQRNTLFNTASTNQHTAYLFIRNGILAFTTLAAMFRFPHAEEEYVSIAMSTIIAVWSMNSISLLKKMYPQASEKRSIFLGMIGLIVLYATLISWQQMPHPWEFPSWFRGLPLYAQNLITIPFGILLSIFVYNIGTPLLLKMSIKTSSSFDDILLPIVRLPLGISIFVIALTHAVVHSVNSDFWLYIYQGTSITILIFLWSWAVLHGSNLLLKEMLQQRDEWLFINARTEPIYQFLIRVVVVTLSIYLLLLAWGINVMLWITSAGVIGIAIAYASQDTLANLFSGMAILSDAPYKLQDFLVLDDGTRGRVTNIGFRSTRLLTLDNIEIIIPNSILANSKVINMSGGMLPVSRIECLASVAYGSDIDKVRALLYEVAGQLDHIILDDDCHKPVVHFVEMGASSLDFVIRIWIDSPEHLQHIKDQANTLIYKTFARENIEIPYTKQDVYLYPMKPFPKNPDV